MKHLCLKSTYIQNYHTSLREHPIIHFEPHECCGPLCVLTNNYLCIILFCHINWEKLNIMVPLLICFTQPFTLWIKTLQEY